MDNEDTTGIGNCSLKKVEFDQAKPVLLSKAQLEHAGVEWSIGDAEQKPCRWLAWGRLIQRGTVAKAWLPPIRP